MHLRSAQCARNDEHACCTTARCARSPRDARLSASARSACHHSLYTRVYSHTQPSITQYDTCTAPRSRACERAEVRDTHAIDPRPRMTRMREHVSARTTRASPLGTHRGPRHASAAPRIMSIAFFVRVDQHARTHTTCRARCAHPREHACASRSGQLGRHIPHACAHCRNTHIMRGSLVLFYDNKAVETSALSSSDVAPHNPPSYTVEQCRCPPLRRGASRPPHIGGRYNDNYAKRRVAVASGIACSETGRPNRRTSGGAAFDEGRSKLCRCPTSIRYTEVSSPGVREEPRCVRPPTASGVGSN